MLPPSRKSIPNALIITTFLISFACLTLYAYHAEIRCFSEDGNASICQNSERACAPGIGFSTSGTLKSGATYKVSLTCPNRFITTVLGILGFVFTYLFLILFFFIKTELQALRIEFALVGGFILGLLLPSSGFLVIDVLTGYLNASHIIDPDSKVFIPFSYVANIVLNLIGITLIPFIIYCGCYREGNSATFSRVNAVSNPHFSQENETNKISISERVTAAMKRSCSKKLSISTPRKSVLISLGVTTLLLTLICLALYGYHALPHCFSQVGNSSESKCPQKDPTLCTPGFSVSRSGTVLGTDVRVSLTCPFRATTTIFGLLGFVGALILLVLFFRATRGNPIMVLGGHVIALLLSSFGLMIADVVNGAKHAKEAENFVFRPGSYVANIVFTFIGVVLIGLITLFGINSERRADASVDTTSTSPNMSQRIEVSDASRPDMPQGGEWSEVHGHSKKGYAMFD